MRKPISLILLCLTSAAFAADPTDSAPAPSHGPFQDAPAVEEEAEAEPEGPTAAELAKDKAEAARAALAEKARLARAAEERKAATGEKHDYITTKKGRTYKKVTIRGVDAIGLRIFHEAGTARIPFAELPEKFQVRFGYDPDRAKQLLAKEQNRESAREQAAIARLREEAGLPPEPKGTTRPAPRPGTTGPKVTRPKTTGPKTTGPKVTRPKTTGPKVTKPKDQPDGSDPAAEDEKVVALKAEMATHEAEIDKIKTAARALEDEAKKAEDKAFANAASGNAKFDEALMKQAQSLRDKADVEFSKADAHRSKISKLKREIKKLERGR